ncbi:hypothetical protein ABT373_31310 [Streptomyces sp. NPDC000070]|uniref:hypothetical protein n=1 Tax=Streptomyces sp. NPDC000070 TaxID=3154240 RepID=UPI00331F5D70
MVRSRPAMEAAFRRAERVTFAGSSCHDQQHRLPVPARRHIAAEGFDPVHGARPLRRFIQREVATRRGRR